MKNLFLIFLLNFSVCLLHAQSWDEAGDCEVNVNNSNYANLPIRQGTINATVKLYIYGTSGNWECSGTLINRNTSDGDVGYYILTAKHCMDGIDYSANHFVIFNYQSPSENNASTPNSNRGIYLGQSISLTDNRYEYSHGSKLRLVNSFTWGDLALFEVLTPIPPHFNVTYAGWNPSRFGTVISTNHNPTDFYGVHHPHGDIKKISGTNSILWLETPIASGCYTITTVIDVLFGWIWGNRISTSVICNYVDNPWLTIADWQYGIVENGSSGSGLFDGEYSSNRLIGVLSGSLATCNFKAISTYGKLHANFSNASIKNTLNPKHNVWVDLFGMGERKITVYDNLTLPGATGVSGQYFPANHYQSNNKISLKANNTIKTTQPMTIYSGADYEFIAGSSITLGPGFKAQSGSTFSAKIGTVGSLKSAESTLEQEVIGKLRSIELPKYKKFEIEKYIPALEIDEKIQISEIFPNPNDGDFTFRLTSGDLKEQLHIELINIQGQTIYSNLIMLDLNAIVNINKTDMPKGLYILKVSGNKTMINKKIIIK